MEERSETGVLLDPANLYRALRRMERDGWVRVVEEEDEGRKRIYAVTTRGDGVLRAELARLERLIERTLPALASEGRSSTG